MVAGKPRQRFRRIAEVDEPRKTGQPRFRERDQLCPGSGRLLNQRASLVDRRLEIEKYRRRLDGRDLECFQWGRLLDKKEGLKRQLSGLRYHFAHASKIPTGR